jgi:DDE_Tnp_1-associated
MNDPLVEMLSCVTDCRREQAKRYRLANILMFCILGFLCGATSYKSLCWTERLSPSARGVKSGVMAEGVYFVDAVEREIARRTINERRPPCRHYVWLCP